MKEKRLFVLCWLAYFTTYLGRLNYSASLSQMIEREGFGKGQAGMIGMGFFLFYGLGQLLSGFLGDRLSAKWMIFWGLAGSAAANWMMVWIGNPYYMTAVWAMNGLVQSLIWSPIIKLFSQRLDKKVRVRACIHITSSVPLGTLTAYGLSAWLIHLFQWRAVFIGAAAVLGVMALIWLFGTSSLEQWAGTEAEERGQLSPQSGLRQQSETAQLSFVMESGMLIICMALVMQGILKDGITTWVPTYLSEIYDIGAVVAILGTAVIPIFNLGGVYAAHYVNQRFTKNELKTSAIFFVIGGSCLVLLRCLSASGLLLSLVLLAFATTAMMAVNTMLVSVLPMYFADRGRSSAASGILNSSAYLGSAFSSYGIGAAAAAYGWDTTVTGWCVCSVIGGTACLLALRRWKSFRRGEVS